MVSFGGSPIPDRRWPTGPTRPRHLAHPGLRLHRAPVGHRQPARQHPRETHPHRRSTAGLRRAADGRRGGTGDARAGFPGEIPSPGARTASPGTPTPALTAASVDPEGWSPAGDVGVVDDDGYLTVTDRVKDIIIRGGENVSAAEVEQLLAKMDGVAEVAVVAAPDERIGRARLRLLPHARPGPGPPLVDDPAGPPQLAAGLARPGAPGDQGGRQ